MREFHETKNGGKGMLYNLCANVWTYAVDILAVVVLCVCAGRAAKKGFVRCLFGLLSTVVALVLAFSLAQSVVGWTNGIFGLQGTIQSSCEKSLLEISAFTVDISSEGIAETLAQQGLPQFLIDMVVENIGNEMVAKGTTLARAVAETVAPFAVTLIAGLIVFILSKLVLRILRNVVSSIVEHIPIISSINSLLGFAVGAVQGLLIVSVVIALIASIPSSSTTPFFNECTIVYWLYNHNPINIVLSWILA